MKSITVRYCSVNNLKDISVSIPKDKLTVVTGVSGSGKSSLAFDVVYAEGKKAYLQAIGVLPNIEANARVGEISGISPAVAVKQNIVRESNPRVLVGTRSSLFDRLRHLMLLEGHSKQSEMLSIEDLNFNSLKGMCLECKGLGQVKQLSIKKVIPDESISLNDICTELYTWTKKDGPNIFLQLHNLDKDIPFSALTEQQREDFLYGFYNREFGRYGGLFPYIKWRAGHAQEGGNKKSSYLSKLFENVSCSRCERFRVRQEAMEMTLNGQHIGQLGLLNVVELKQFLLDYLHRNFYWRYEEQAKKEINGILNRVENFIDVELGHLTLYRELRTLSGGELQRFQLMTYLQAETDSLVYVFDEPTLGLHELEKRKVIQKLIHLKELGNTVIIVDHDKSVIESAEYVIDIGPGAGKNGGKIMYEGSLAGLLKSPSSITGTYLSHYLHITEKSKSDYKLIDTYTPVITMQHVTMHNLKDVSVNIPLGVIVGIAGVSGSGKSSLISSVLLPSLKQHFKFAIDEELNEVTEVAGEFTTASIIGLEHVAGFAAVTQEPIGRNKRSTPVTYLKIWEEIRSVFANLDDAKRAGLGAEYFSFNSVGACPVCQGMGDNEKALGIMGTVIGPCHECDGKRFRSEVLQIEYKGRNIFDVLNMETSEAIEYFAEVPKVKHMLSLLERTGMGYITLGQPTSTLSGGEAQRIKLARELGLARKGNVLYILDEPTAGLSFSDTTKLLHLLDELVNNGNSIIVIEHDPRVLTYCDWIIELGPGGASQGGNIIAEGSPLELRYNEQSIIGPFL